MSQTCTKCNKVVKAFQRLLVYEPVKEPCKTCDRPRPYPSAPPFGTTIKVCSFGEMERMCFPKLCDCPCREMPLCPEARRREMICRAIYWFATFALFAYLFDSGIFRHPVHTTRLTDSLKEMISELYTKEEAKEEEEEERKAEGKDAKGKDGKDAKAKEGEAQKTQKEEKHKDPKREYDKATKTYNVANVWNSAVIGAGDLLITLVKLPKFVFFKTMEAITGCEEDEKKDEKVKDLKHEKKEAAKKDEPKKTDDKKQEAKKDEPKKADDKKQEAKKDAPKKTDDKKQEAKKDAPKKGEEETEDKQEATN